PARGAARRHFHHRLVRHAGQPATDARPPEPARVRYAGLVPDEPDRFKHLNRHAAGQQARPGPASFLHGGPGAYREGSPLRFAERGLAAVGKGTPTGVPVLAVKVASFAASASFGATPPPWTGYLGLNSPRGRAARPRQETGQSAGACKKPWCVVPKEVGAPACGIGVALGANALTPRGTDLVPVVGPGLAAHHGTGQHSIC